MPSGSRGGGGGGSHGGSRGGGGSSRSGGSGGSHGGGIRLVVHTRTRSSIRIRSRRGGPNRYFDLEALHSIVCVILVLCFMLFGGMTCSAKENVEFLTEDYDYYQNMITYAELHPDDYIVDAKVTSYSFRADFDKYYINYSIPYEVREYFPGMGYQEVTKYLSGYSFSVYTLEEAKELKNQGIIKVAIDTKVVTSNTDSVPMDYKDFELEDDGEYALAVRNQARHTRKLICLGVFAVAWFTFFIIASNKLGKIYDKERIEEAKKSKSTTYNSSDAIGSDTSYCQYCGTYLVKDNNIKCPACGATKTIKK